MGSNQRWHWLRFFINQFTSSPYSNENRTAMRNILFASVIGIALSACKGVVGVPTSASPTGYSKSSSETTSCQLVEKAFIKKNGQPSEHKELYLRCSIQDYFIKLCESDVSYEELKPYIGQGITVKMTIEEGEWDICPDDPTEMQSRIGTYVTIKEMVK